MKQTLTDILACPHCAGQLATASSLEQDGEIESGALECMVCARGYPIERGIPRFVPAGNYAANFGVQWNRFRKTQLDSHTGLPISRDRFFESTGWSPSELEGALVLDVGCGAGRFTEVALDCGAEVVALDYSSAVDACLANHRGRPNLSVVQADVYRLPFAPARFDFVYCLGVLQHTPDVKRAFLALPPMLRFGGRIAVDVYPDLWRARLSGKYLVRPFTTRLPHDRLLSLIEQALPWAWPVSRAVGSVPVLGSKLRQLLPISNYTGVYPLSEDQLREWALLDTYDMLAAVHDRPQSRAALQAWFEETGLEEVRIFRRGHFVGRGRRKGASGDSGRSVADADQRSVA